MKRILLLAVATFCVLSGFAQSNEQTVVKEEYLSSADENWFLSAGVGAEFNAHKSINNSTFDIPTFARFYFTAGKWVSPYFAFRATAAFTSFSVESMPSDNKFILDGQTSSKGGITALGVDVMMNLSNMIGGYKMDRIYVAKPFVGLEANYAYSTNDRLDGLYEYFPLIGINNEFNVSKSFSINCEVAAAVTNINRYGESKHAPFVYPIRTSVGVTYYLGRGKAREFRKAVSADHYYALYRDNEALTNELTNMKQNNVALARDVEALQKDLETVKVQKTQSSVIAQSQENQFEIAPVATFFELNKSNVTKEDVARLKFVAAIMKEQPDVKFVIEGYADSATGSGKRNQELSQKRAEAVCNVLIEKYGVKASQLQAVGMGETDSLFDDMTLNRAVITKTTK